MIKGHLVRNEERIDFSIPEGWSELTLETFEKIKEDSNALEVFSFLSGLDIEFIKLCDVKEVEFIVSQLDDLFKEKDLEDLKEVVGSFKVKGRTFVLPTDILSIKAGQYWDIKKVEELYKGKPIEAVRALISYLAIEEGKEYDYKDVEEKLELFKELTVELGFKIRSFFLANLVLSMTDLNLSSIKNTKRKNLKRGTILLVVSTVLYLPSIVWLKIKRLSRLFSERRKR